MIRETYAVGKKLYDGEGTLWMIANAWEYQNKNGLWWCMQLVGVNNLEISGGTRILIEDTGGMAVAVR